MKHSGWILDLYHRKGQMVVWLKKEDGSCVRLVDPWKPRIHVCGGAQDLLRLSSEHFVPQSCWTENFERPGDRGVSRCLEIEVDDDREAEKLAGRIQQHGHFSKLRIYDVDVPAVQMYLYSKDLFPLAFVEAEVTSSGISWTLRDSRERTDYLLPDFRIARLELSTCKLNELRSGEDRLGQIRLGSRVMDSGDESDKILQLSEAVRETDPDIILTDGGDSFIFPFLTRRAQRLGILDKLVLGREESPLRIHEVQGHSYFSYGKVLYRDTAARLLGRLHFDERNAFITCDCGLEGLFEISRTCIMPLQKASRATIGTNMTSLQLYNAISQNVLIPWNKNEAEEWKGEVELLEADRGGFVYEPETGLYDNIGELDFSSLYPTLMLKNNLSGETVKCGCCSESQIRVPELGDNICQRWEGIVPRSLGILLRKRAEFKRLKKKHETSPKAEVYEARQAALKWILVCSFGYLGFKNARFGRIDAHIATCAFARQALRKAREVAASNGFNLVHGIVDSMWLHKKGATAADYEKLCAIIRENIGLPVSFEGIYKWIAFLGSRVESRLPVLNRYFGVRQDGTFRVRGIELRKRDSPKLVVKCQREMLNVFANSGCSLEFRALIPTAIRILEKYVLQIMTGNVSLRDVIIRKNMSKAPSEYLNLVPQAVGALHLIRNGENVHAGQSISYVLTRQQNVECETQALPPKLFGDQVKLDALAYVDLLISCTRNLFDPLGFDEGLIRATIGLCLQ